MGAETVDTGVPTVVEAGIWDVRRLLGAGDPKHLGWLLTAAFQSWGPALHACNAPPC